MTPGVRERTRGGPRVSTASTGKAVLERPWLCACGVGLLAVALRATFSLVEGDLYNDGPVFIAAAEALARGDLDGLLRSPQHPLTSQSARVQTRGGRGKRVRGCRRHLHR